MGRTSAEADKLTGTEWTTVSMVLAALAGGPMGPIATTVPENGSLCRAGPAPVVSDPRAVNRVPARAFAPNDAPEYYMFELVTTGRIPGTGLASGSAQVLFSESPFGISIGLDGSYLYDVSLRVEGFYLAPQAVLTVWFTTPDLSRVERAGVIEQGAEFWGQVAWNKFLAVITVESSDDPAATMWSGPVALRGMSRSGRMHTMAGHGPFEQENCATYGYR